MNKSYQLLLSITASASTLLIFINPSFAAITLPNSVVQLDFNKHHNSEKVRPIYKGTCDVNPNLPGC